MTGLAILFVSLSAIAHASWNLLLKRARSPQAFSWWMNASVGIFLVPLGAILLWLQPPSLIGWVFVLGTILLHVAYFFFLSRGYENADLSIVYPIARGTGPALIPLFGVFLLDETISLMAVFGIVCVVIGIFVTYWGGKLTELVKNPLSGIKNKGIRFALLTGLVIATYSVWDKVGVQHVQPFLYLYLMLAGTAVIFGPITLKTTGREAMKSEWRKNKGWILAAAALSFMAYGLVLTALTFSRVSYIAPARESGIAFGVLLGILVLREPSGATRLTGAALILLGLVLISISP